MFRYLLAVFSCYFLLFVLCSTSLEVYASESSAELTDEELAKWEEAGYLYYGYDEVEGHIFKNYNDAALYSEDDRNPIELDVGKFTLKYSIGNGSTVYSVSTKAYLEDSAQVYFTLPWTGGNSYLKVHECYFSTKTEETINFENEALIMCYLLGICPGEDMDNGLFTYLPVTTYKSAYNYSNRLYIDGLYIDGANLKNNVRDTSLDGYTDPWFPMYVTYDGVYPSNSSFDIYFKKPAGATFTRSLDGYDWFTVNFSNYIWTSSDKLQEVLVKEMSDDVAELNETNKGILERIKALPENLWNKFQEGLKALFIPEDGWLEAEFDKLKASLEDSLGFLAFPLKFLTDFVDLFKNTSASDDFIITMPTIYFGDHVLFKQVDFALEGTYSELPFMKTLFDALHIFVKFAIITSLCWLGSKKINLILTGVSDNDN